MAALLCMGDSTFRDYVKRNLLPAGVLVGSLRRWKVSEISDALDRLRKIDSDTTDPFLTALRGDTHGAKPNDRHYDA